MAQRLACILGIRADKTPAILTNLDGVSLLTAEILDAEGNVIGVDSTPVERGVYRLRVQRGAESLAVDARRAHPDTATSVQLGLPAGAPSAAPDGKWGIWWLMPVEDISRHLGLRILRALNRLSRSAKNDAGGAYHITPPRTWAHAVASWAPAAADAVLRDDAGAPVIPSWQGDPAPAVQAAWDYRPSDAECDADADLDDASLDAVYGTE